MDIPDPTYRKLKAKAAEQRCFVKELVLRGIEQELKAGVRRKGRIQLPTVHSKEPGKLRLTNQRIYEVIPFP